MMLSTVAIVPAKSPITLPAKASTFS